MSDAYIVDAIRVPTGKRGGGLSQIHPVDLGAFVLRSLVERTGVPPEAVDDVIFGCVDQLGAQAANLARQAWLASGMPESVPGTTLDRQCGSSQQAAHFAAQGVMAGEYDLVVAGGVEVMSTVPINSSTTVGIEQGFGDPYGGEGLATRYGDQEISQFRGAELIARKWGLSRQRLEEFALSSHQRAARAWEEGRFDNEVVSCAGVERDEGIRAETTLEKMASLPSLPGHELLTAAVASQVSDGAATMLIASEAAIERYGLRPRARFHAFAVVGSDPIMMLSGPIPATAKILERASMSIDEIDLFEINEAFAPVVLAWAAESGADLEKTNVNGGAIALGHPLGASGAKLMATMLNELERTGGRYGLQSMCEGGGTANATIIERL
jgi:acetyl-CoA C-acetyltransferase